MKTTGPGHEPRNFYDRSTHRGRKLRTHFFSEAQPFGCKNQVDKNEAADKKLWLFNPIAYGGGEGIFIPHHHCISCHSETT